MKMTLALAASILTLTLSAFPNHAAATSTTATPPPPPPPTHSGTHIAHVTVDAVFYVLVQMLSL
jgi:hypothetical protein